MTEYDKILVSIEVKTQEKIWNRTYLTEYVPTNEQFLCYYRTLCGFGEADVNVERTVVPAGFNTALLKPLDSAPSNFPQSDIETEPEEEEKRENYKRFIKGLIDMEHSRLNLNFFITKPLERTGKRKQDYDGFRAWVADVINTLSNEVNTDDVNQKYPTIGWLITASSKAARHANGYRLITDPVIGIAWEKLLGTDHFPDLIVARKIHASNWRYDDEKSNLLFHNILDWYIHAKMAVYSDGISDWLQGIDVEINSLILAFQNILPVKERTHPLVTPRTLLPVAFELPHNNFVEKGIDPEFDTMPSAAFPTTSKKGKRVITGFIPIVGSNLEKGFAKTGLRPEFYIQGVPNIPTPNVKSVNELLELVETLLAATTSWPEAIEPITEDTFYNYLITLCKKMKINVKQLEEDYVSNTIERWIQKGYGFRPDLWPIVNELFPLWRAVIRDKATEERVCFFITTANLEPIITNVPVKADVRNIIVGGWLTIFMETFLICDSRGYIQALDLHEQCRLFCLQFVPENPWKKYFTPMSIGPYFTNHGFITKKEPQLGRRVYGIRYRNVSEKAFVMPTVPK
jgi:hypothetical protein